MKIVINYAYGAYSVPAPIMEKLNCSHYDDSIAIRTNPLFIEYVSNRPELDLIVINIPDSAKNLDIIEHDGMEHINATINGKLYHFSPDYYNAEFEDDEEDEEAED